jgi:hypothetical protein
MKERHIPETVILDAVDAIINARDFCGNEREAAFEVAAEHGFRAERTKVHRIANFRANAEWNAWKKRAGVNPKHIF